jgi:bifunctional non-homologous end joining protein LigD
MAAALAYSQHMPFPEWVVPMAATLTDKRFTGPEWIFERKYDGIRLLSFRKGATVRLFSRNQLPQHYSSIDEAIGALDVNEVILDGEVDWGGRNVHYHVFDILWLDGRNLMPLPFIERRTILHHLALVNPLHAVAELTGERPWEQACREGWEGVIAKRRDSLYEHRRSPHWLKMKCEASQELVVGGFTDPQRTRKGLGALLLGYFEGEDFVFAGKVGTGFDTKQLIALRSRLDAIELAQSPFTRAVGLPRLRAHWVQPEIVVQIAFIEWTVHGKLRHGRFLGFREDKIAREVVREAP